VIRLFRGIGAGDPDEVVQTVSAYLADTLASMREPLECRPGFMIRN
jgi:hypothetical protein